MKHFFESHILFPKKLGIVPYFWLIFLIPSLSYFPSLPQNQKWLALGLIFIFLKAYRDGFEGNRWMMGYVVIQLAVSLLFNAMNMTGLFIFTAWQIGFFPIQRKRFYKFLVVYYGFSLMNILIVFSWLQGMDLNQASQLIIVLLFAIFSPLVARSVNESMTKTAKVIRENKRLEAVIRQGERDRIARDLHDNLGQSFSMITLKTELAQKLLVKQPDKVAQELTEIAQISRNNLQLVRQIVSGLENRSIAKTLIEEETFLTTAGIYLQTTGEEIAEHWPDGIQTTYAAILKEACTNVIRHSQAQTVWCTFAERPEEYRVTIFDNGIGMANSPTDSHGLKGMRARALEHHGQLTIDTRKGTELCISLPKADKKE